MQRRLIEELQILDLNINLIRDSYYNIEFILNKLLSAPDKAFEVTFKDVAYNFVYPTTEQERQDMMHLRRNLLNELFKEVFVQMVDGKNPWDMIRVFASGIDTLDMQIEIIGKEEMMESKSVDGSNPKIALDEASYQVKQELENKKRKTMFDDSLTKDQKLLLIEKFINETLKDIEDKNKLFGDHEYFQNHYYPELNQCYPDVIRNDENDFDFFQKLIQSDIDKYLDCIVHLKWEKEQLENADQVSQEN